MQQLLLLVLNKQFEALLKCGLKIALLIFSKLQLYIRENTYRRTGAVIEISVFFKEEMDVSLGQDSFFLRRLCKMAATLVLLYATSNDLVCLYNALKLQTHSLGGLLNYKFIRKTLSASLFLDFRRAKLAAINYKQTTVLAVALVDVHIFELAQRGKSELYFSFTYVFTMGVGLEGVIIWQAWGKHRYWFDKYINNRHARVRGWSEAN